MVDSDIFSHYTPLELILTFPSTIPDDAVIPRLAKAAPAILFITFAMFSVQAVECILSYCYRHDRNSGVTACRNLDKAILHHELMAVGVSCSVLPVRIPILRLGSDVMSFDSI